MSFVLKVKKWNKNRVLKRIPKGLDEKNSYTITETIYGEPVLVRTVKNDELLTIELLYVVLNKTYRATFLGIYKGTELEIADIKVLKQLGYSPSSTKPFGKGYGSVLMTMAIKEAETKGIVQITGERVATSPEQFNRQEKFYTKFGFSIDEENKLFKAL